MTPLRVSVFQRRLGELVWVAVALLAILPLLVVLAMMALSSDGGRSLLNAQVVLLGIFVAVSVGCGLAILLQLSRRMEAMARQSSELMAQASGGAAEAAADEEEGRPGGRNGADQNELTSLAHSLSCLQTELNRNLGALQSQAEFLDGMEQALDASVDMVVMMDCEGRILFSNQSARRKLGLLPDGNPKRALAESFLRGQDANRLAEVLTRWETMDREFTFEQEDREPFIVHCIQSVSAPADGKESKIVILRDVTEHARMKRQLYRSEKLAALGQLISGVAHELNNPLTAILGFAEICRDPELKKAELYENLEVIEHEAMRTASVVENLLNFSRRRESQRSTVNLRELLERCLTLLAYNFRTADISVNRHYTDDVCASDVDEFHIQQVFMNLMINAAQAMRDSETVHPTITVATLVEKETGRPCVEIRDNGPGIPEEIRAQIFSPFFTTKKEGQGTGLGLTVSKNIVEDHGGRLQVKTEAGKGTAFVVSFAAPKGTTLLKASETAAKRDDSRSEASGAPPPKGRVLVMDDEVSILSMAEQVLTSAGLEVKLVRTLSEARELIGREAFDVVVADVHMPDGDGEDVLDFIEDSETSRDCGCVFITGNPRKAAEMSQKHGDLTTLIKPFRLQDFCDEVTDCITLRNVTGESSS